MNGQREINARITDIRFGSDPSFPIGTAFVSGYVESSGIKYCFVFAITPESDGQWQLRGLQWGDLLPPASVKNSPELIKALLDNAAKFLISTDIWVDEKGDMQVGHIWVADAIPSTCAVSFRHGMLKLPTSQAWDDVWSSIEGRIRGDSRFLVQGFKNEDILVALKNLKTIFPAEWIEATYKRNTSGNVNLASEFPPEAADLWFPAQHFARTALGAICIDPAWNYLIEIGLALEELKGFENYDLLRKNLVKNPGDIHGLCMAANFHKRKILGGIEPNTGSGNAKNDLAVIIDEKVYHIEVKDFSSKKPDRKLQREINDKLKKIPRTPEYPLIFHVVLSEDKNGQITNEKERKVLQELDTIVGSLPPQISAVVVGSRFIDSEGGHVKREIVKAAINPKALHTVPQKHIDRLFGENFTKTTYPHFGLDTLFYIHKSPCEERFNGDNKDSDRIARMHIFYGKN